MGIVLRIAVLAPAAMCLALPLGYGATLQGNPENYRALLSKLQPGDKLVLAPGVYGRGMPLQGVQGTAQRPITIHGPMEGPPAVLVAREGQNTVSLSNTAHVHIANLLIDGRNAPVDAIKAEGHRQCNAVHHITLQDLLIIGHGASQGNVGISTKCLAWNWVIRRNVIVGAGTGLYLGDSDGNKQFIGGLIEQNLLLDTVGYNLQIKHQKDRPVVSGMPAERTRTVIRHNLFSKAHGASMGVDARPNLLLGHFPRQGAGVDDAYEVANNLFYCNPGEVLLQAEGNVTITGNVMVNPVGSAISIFPHNDVPKSIRLDSNFVAASGKGASIVKASPAHSQTVTNNWFFSPSPLAGGAARDNRLAPFPTSEAHLIQWLATPSEAEARRKSLAPLLDFAGRVCSRDAVEQLPEAAAAQEHIRNHPVCRLVELMAGGHSSSAVQPDRLSAPCAF